MDTFAIDVAKFRTKTAVRTTTIVRKVSIELLRNVVLATPVGNPDLWKSPAPKGYVGGRLRANWVVGIGSVNERADAPPDKSGGAATAKGVSTLLRASIKPQGGDMQDVYLTNSLPYAREIEYTGHSKQAPAGMVRITVANYQRFIEAAARSFK